VALDQTPLRGRLLNDLHVLRQGAGLNVEAVGRARSLLGLPCVRVLGSADELPRLVYDQVIGWVAQYPNEDRRAALQNAFALDPQSLSKLTQRRKQFSERANLTMQSVRDREDAGINDLIDSLLDDCANLAGELLTQVSQARFPTSGSDEGALRPAYQDVEVMAALSPGPSSEYVSLRVTISARVPDAMWLVAITHDEFLAERLCAFSEAINEIVCPGPLGNAAGINLELTTYSSSAIHPRTERVQLQPIGPEEAERLTGLEGLAKLTDVEWLSADLSHEDDSLIRISFTYSQSLHLSSRYCFWTAPRRCFLSRMVFDVAGFPGSDGHHFSLRPFVGVPATVKEGDDILELRVDSLVERGHGAALVWGDRRP
jgi:hypothetical protein